MTELRLYMFQSGSLKCKLHNIKMNQGLNEPYEIPVPWFLIQYPKGSPKTTRGSPANGSNDCHRT
jgi:N-acyl homoserine lactone hydrolase